MKLKNVLLTCLSMVLVAALAIGGTVAYLTSEDSDVNVMTKGNVKIAQHEYQRVVNADGTYATDTIDDQYSYVLEAFEQAKPLLPIVGDPSSPEGYAYAGWDETTVRMSQVDSYGGMQVFAGKNAQDKFVTVENTGITDAYVRTLVAIEVGTADAGLIGTSYHMTWTENEIGIIEFDDNKFLLIEFVYNGASSASRHENGVLPAGDTSYPSLAQIYLGSEATNEDCEKLDGNKNGTLDIIVLSQAVQAAGFADAQIALDTAFGDITTINHPWKDGVVEPVVKVCYSVEELTSALADPTVSVIILTEGNYGLIDVTDVNRTVTVAAAADATARFSGINGQSNATTTNITFKGVTIDNSLQADGWYTGTSQNMKPCVGVWGGFYTFENCTFYVTGESGAETGVMSWWTTNHCIMNFTNCTFNGGNDRARAMQIYGKYDLNATGCTFNTAKDYSLKFVGDAGCMAILRNNTVNNTTNFVQTGSPAYPGENYSLVFEGNTLADGIKHVYIENAEGQAITINGEAKEATDEEIY